MVARNSSTRRITRAFGWFFTLAIQMGTCIFAGWWFGDWLDKRYGTGQWLMITFFMAGTVAAFLTMYRMIKLFERMDSRDREAEEKRRRGSGE